MKAETRIGDAERKKLTDELRAAWYQGYLTEEMFTERAARAAKAEIQEDILAVKQDLPEIEVPRQARHPLGRVWMASPCVALLFFGVLVAIGPSEYLAAMNHGQGYISFTGKIVETFTIIGGVILTGIGLVATAIALFDSEDHKFKEVK